MNLSSSRRTVELSQRRKKEIASLAVRKYREELGEMLIEGARSVEAAIDGGAPIREIVVTSEAAKDSRIAALLGRCDAPAYVVTPREMKAISEVETSQGVLAVAAIEMLAPSELKRFARILAFDAVQDPGNAGTTIRTAAWFGVEALVTAPGTVDLYNPKVVRAAMGGLWDIHHAEADDLATALKELQVAGFRLFGADTEGTTVDRWRPAPRSVLILGSEAHGLSAKVQELLDERVCVPGSDQRRGTESLNVGVAAGILLYEWTKNTRPA